MYNAPMATVITEGISEQQKATAKFQSAYQDMLRQLKAPGFAHVLSCHEAAHLFYYKLVGTKTYKAFPASLSYDQTIDDYSGSMASVQVLDMTPPTQGKIGEWLAGIAVALAAGGVVARKLMTSIGGPWPDPTGGDQNDRQYLGHICKEFASGGIPIDAEKLWKVAQDSVLQDLSEHPQRLVEIEELARELRPELGL
jgi:hypothetical protein